MFLSSCKEVRNGAFPSSSLSCVGYPAFVPSRLLKNSPKTVSRLMGCVARVSQLHGGERRRFMLSNSILKCKRSVLHQKTLETASEN